MPRPRVLLVCTANICRSPAAQRLLAARTGPGIDYFSRGVLAVPGAGMCGFSGNWLAARGAFGVGAESAVAHVARQLTEADVRDSSLVLTATESQQARILSMVPAAQARTYPLLEAARIVSWLREQEIKPRDDADISERLTWLVANLQKHRASAPRPREPGWVPGAVATRLGRRRPHVSDDLADPHQGGEHPVVLPQLDQAAAVLAETLRRPA